MTLKRISHVFTLLGYFMIYQRYSAHEEFYFLLFVHSILAAAFYAWVNGDKDESSSMLRYASLAGLRLVADLAIILLLFTIGYFNFSEPWHAFAYFIVNLMLVFNVVIIFVDFRLVKYFNDKDKK